MNNNGKPERTLTQNVARVFGAIVSLGGSLEVETRFAEYREVRARYEEIYRRAQVSAHALNEELLSLASEKRASFRLLKAIARLASERGAARSSAAPSTERGATAPGERAAIGSAIVSINSSLHLAGGAGMGALAGGASWLAVSTFGTASTGAAIGGLSGAAATNATLAWFGGGSLAVGGGGMAAGVWVLGGIVALPLLALTVGLSVSAAGRKLNELNSEIKKAEDATNQCAEFLSWSEHASGRARRVRRELNAAFEEADACYQDVVDQFHRVPILSRLGRSFLRILIGRRFVESERSAISELVHHGAWLARALETPVLLADGSVAGSDISVRAPSSWRTAAPGDDARPVLRALLLAGLILVSSVALISILAARPHDSLRSAAHGSRSPTIIDAPPTTALAQSIVHPTEKRPSSAVVPRPAVVLPSVAPPEPSPRRASPTATRMAAAHTPNSTPQRVALVPALKSFDDPRFSLSFSRPTSWADPTFKYVEGGTTACFSAPSPFSYCLLSVENDVTYREGYTAETYALGVLREWQTRYVFEEIEQRHVELDGRRALLVDGTVASGGQRYRLLTYMIFDQSRRKVTTISYSTLKYSRTSAVPPAFSEFEEVIRTFQFREARE